MTVKIENDYQENVTYGLSSEFSKNIIDNLVDNKKEAKKLLLELHAADIADFLEVISKEQRQQVIKILGKSFDPEILVELTADTLDSVLGILGVSNSADFINKLETDDAVDVIENLDEEDQIEILQAIPEKERADLEEGLAYPDDSAGRLIDKKFVAVPEFWTVGQTIDYLRKTKGLPADFYEIFIVNPKYIPVGGVLLSRIMCSSRVTKLKDIMRPDIKPISSSMDQEDVAFIFHQYGLAASPVVNDEGRMIGVINVDDVVDVIQEEAQEDIMRLGGIKEADLHSNFKQTVKRRFPWLIINLLTAILASIVIAFFEGAIEKLATLAVLMPIVASMGGNAGTQTLTVAVRAIATKELTGTNALRVIGKEILVGGINGLLFAIICGVLSYMWYQNTILSIVFSIATIFTLLMASMSGALIPLGLEKLKIDPAIASGVFLTTITDIVAFGIFLGLSAMILL